MRTNTIALAFVCAACTRDVPVGELSEVASLKAIPNQDLDILFVVDNSPSMAEEQVSLAQSFPLMMDVLATLDNGLPNLHIGVVTSDMGTYSSLTGTPANPIGAGAGECRGTGDNGALVQGTYVTDRYISDIADGNGGRIVNYTGALRDAFGQLAFVGDGGCGFEQHLRAMQTALDAHPDNAGFLRPNANLAVVILADEDDCSALRPELFSAPSMMFGALQSFRCFQFGVECAPDDPTTPGTKQHCKPRTNPAYVDDVDPFATFLTTLKGDPRKVMVAGVVGVPQDTAEVVMAMPPGGATPLPTLGHSCVYQNPNAPGPQTADPAIRLAHFFDQFPDRATLTSICDADLSGALGEIGESAKRLMGDPCLDTSKLADVSEAPGVQPSCEVLDIRDSAPDDPLSIPSCATATGDCFELVEDLHACPTTNDHVRLRIHRSAAVSDEVWTSVRCQLRSR